MTRTKRLGGWVGVALLTSAAAIGVADSSYAQPKKGGAKAPPPKVTGVAAAKPAKKCVAVDVDKAKAGGEDAIKKESGRAYKEGEKAYKAKDWECAYQLFLAADAIRPGGKPKYYAGSAADKLGKIKEALSLYQSFLDTNPDASKSGDLIKDSKDRIDALKVMPGLVKLSLEPPGAKLLVDGKEMSGPELKLPGGKHTLVASMDKHETVTKEIDVKADDSIDVKIALPPKMESPPPPPPPSATEVASAPPPPTQSAPPPPPPKKEEKSKVPAIVTLGLAGAGTVVGVIFGVLALDTKSQFDKNPTTALADETDRNALIADMSFAVAVTFAVTGTVLLLTSGDDKEEKKEEKKAFVPPSKQKSPVRGFVAPMVLPNGGGLAGAMRF